MTTNGNATVSRTLLHEFLRVAPNLSAELVGGIRAALEQTDAAHGTVKWTKEEIAAGMVGIRWVNPEGVHGRPTDHDVREYLLRTPSAMACRCDECKLFYSPPAPVQEPVAAQPRKAVKLTDDEIAKAWAVGEHNASAVTKRRITTAIQDAFIAKNGIEQ